MCSVMYKESDYWYQYWTRFVTNKEDVKNECFYPGTKLIYEPFNLSVTMDFTGIPLNGRYNVIATIKAFSLKNVERDTSICFGIEGEFNRL
ncbi:uncharacterized protein LOC111605037 [Drosophila hydei]|uniref:Uncharacterized protein LOC111605037 n=1 Tax=Drosophila hydei TaxID=7224 RepID=A0A6J2SRI7_DROHY|nr:uncharacterized protein LOC111605037 [Drosophila hydei]